MRPNKDWETLHRDYREKAESDQTDDQDGFIQQDGRRLQGDKAHQEV